MSCASEAPASGPRSELCCSPSPLHTEGSVLTKQWRAPHDSACPLLCHNSQRCPGLHHPALCDLDVGPMVGFRSFIQQSTRPGGPGWAGLLRCECPRRPEQVSDALTHHHPGRSPLGLNGADSGGHHPRPWAGWAGRTWLTLGGRDSRFIFKEQVWIFTTLPGFIGVIPELTLFPSTPRKTGSDPPSASSAPPNRRSQSRAIGGPPSSAPGCPLQHLSKQT